MKIDKLTSVSLELQTVETGGGGLGGVGVLVGDSVGVLVGEEEDRVVGEADGGVVGDGVGV